MTFNPILQTMQSTFSYYDDYSYLVLRAMVYREEHCNHLLLYILVTVMKSLKTVIMNLTLKY